jgi:hypothetical protein
MEIWYHIITEQTTATDPTIEMENYDKEDRRNASQKTKHTTHHIIHQENALPNHTEHKHYWDEDKNNQTQH